MAGDDRLGDEAEKAFRRADSGEEQIILPSIVVAESVYVAESHGYDVEIEGIVDDLSIARNYRLKPMNHSILASLSTDDRDLSIHDKIIVLTAERMDAGILSKDLEIKDHADVEVIW